MKFISKHIKSEFLKNVLVLFSGTSIAQAIPFITAPIISRMYAPEKFGELEIVLSVAAIFSIIATFQYESAIMLPKQDEDAFNLLALCFLITILTAFSSGMIITCFENPISEILDTTALKKWCYVIPVLVLLAGIYNSLNIWASRKRKFKRLAIRQIAQSAVQASTKLALGGLKYFNSGLMLGTISGQVTSTGVLAIITIREDKSLIQSVNRERMISNAITYKDFPKYTMWHGFFDVVNASGIIFILSSFYGAAVVGFYSFTMALLQKPSQMIGSAVSQVFYQKASSKISNNLSVHEDVIAVLKNLSLVGLIFFLPIFVGGQYIFAFIFGENWREAGYIAQIISPLLFLRFIGTPLSKIAIIKQKQKAFFLISFGMNTLMLLTMLVSGLITKSYVSSFISVAIIMTVYFIFTIRWMVKLTTK